MKNRKAEAIREAVPCSSGDSAQIDSNRDCAVVMCAGCGGKVKAKKGSWR